MSEELKKAAKDYCRKMEFSSIMSRDLDFIAGAEWQYQKDRLEFAKLKAKEWQDGFDAGVEAKEKQMISSAIDWVVEDWSPEPHPEITVPLNPNKYKMGDMVKVIIINELI